MGYLELERVGCGGAGGAGGGRTNMLRLVIGAGDGAGAGVVWIDSPSTSSFCLKAVSV